MRRCTCLALAALVLTGCGGGNTLLSKDAYQERLRSAFTAANAELRPHAGGPVATLTRVAKAYRGIAVALRNVHPPADAKLLNQRLVFVADERAASLEQLVARLRTAPPATRQQLLARFDAALSDRKDDFDAAVSGLEARGYRFRPSAGT